MNFTDFLENELLDHVFGGADYVRPATLFLALSTTTPNDDGTNFTEPVGGSYARKSVTNNATEWPAASGGTKQNANTQTFVTATASWGLVTHMGIFDASTGGNNLAIGPLTVPKTIDSGDTAAFPATDITITLD